MIIASTNHLRYSNAVAQHETYDLTHKVADIQNAAKTTKEQEYDSIVLSRR